MNKADVNKNKRFAPKKQKVTLMVALQNELRTHAQEALRLKTLIDEAKTNTKKQYFKKKLTKNNQTAVRVLTAIEQVKKNEKSKTDE